jgi:hypothetical protein
MLEAMKESKNTQKKFLKQNLIILFLREKLFTKDSNNKILYIDA